MEHDTQAMRLLMEIGFLAGGYGMSAESEKIFGALQSAYPESELPLIGQAMTFLNKGKPEDAIRLLRDQALKVNPASEMAKSFLGLALKLGGYASESEAVLKEIVRNGANDQAVAMARSLLNELKG